mmetsp:Transcript_47312/g.92282  ORF Transcript_47312/g.92282 Transcript_47312/m.92282 type:complete len:328 (+) Transcript_47312:94-1077(+)
MFRLSSWATHRSPKAPTTACTVSSSRLNPSRPMRVEKSIFNKKTSLLILLSIVFISWYYITNYSFRTDTENLIKTATNYLDECSSENLYENPLNFAKCVREDPTPSCEPSQVEIWDAWVGNRYTEFGGKCITPQLMKEQNKEWAISGRGSSLAYTEEVRKLLKTLLGDPSYNIKTFLDCPCGDWLWMQTVDLSSVKYFGADITAKSVDENTKCFESSNVHFHVLDWSCSIPPPVDLLMVRDMLFHFNTKRVLDVLNQINRSGAKYLLTTTFPNTTKVADNKTFPGYGYRDLNLYGPPFNLPEPLMKTGVEARGGRHMALFKLPISLI